MTLGIFREHKFPNVTKYHRICKKNSETLCELMAQNFVRISFLMSPNPEWNGPLGDGLREKTCAQINKGLHSHLVFFIITIVSYWGPIVIIFGSFVTTIAIKFSPHSKYQCNHLLSIPIETSAPFIEMDQIWLQYFSWWGPEMIAIYIQKGTEYPFFKWLPFP